MLLLSLRASKSPLSFFFLYISGKEYAKDMGKKLKGELCEEFKKEKKEFCNEKKGEVTTECCFFAGTNDSFWKFFW